MQYPNLLYMKMACVTRLFLGLYSTRIFWMVRKYSKKIPCLCGQGILKFTMCLLNDHLLALNAGGTP
jgi:hypothetical protein